MKLKRVRLWERATTDPSERHHCCRKLRSWKKSCVHFRKSSSRRWMSTTVSFHFYDYVFSISLIHDLKKSFRFLYLCLKNDHLPYLGICHCLTLLCNFRCIIIIYVFSVCCVIESFWKLNHSERTRCPSRATQSQSLERAEPRPSTQLQSRLDDPRTFVQSPIQTHDTPLFSRDWVLSERTSSGIPRWSDILLIVSDLD